MTGQGQDHALVPCLQLLHPPPWVMLPLSFLHKQRQHLLITCNLRTAGDAAPSDQPILGLQGFSKAGWDLGDHLIQPLLGF